MDSHMKFLAVHRYVTVNWTSAVDGPKDVWNYKYLKGDCEDYVFAIIWYYSDCSKWKFYWNVLFGPFRFWFTFVKPVSPVNGHMVLEYRKNELCTEVLHQTMAPQNWYTNMVFKHPFNKIRVVFKLIRGAMIRG